MFAIQILGSTYIYVEQEFASLDLEVGKERISVPSEVSVSFILALDKENKFRNSYIITYKS